MTKAILGTNTRLGHQTTKGANLRNLGGRYFGTTIALPFQPAVVNAFSQPNAIGMRVVFPTSDPLKIFGNVVRLISIAMVNLKSRISHWFKECSGNKTMDSDLLMGSVLLKRNPQIPVLGRRWFKNLSRIGATGPSGAPYPTEGTHFVGPILDWFPCFHVIDCLNPTSNGQWASRLEVMEWKQ